MVGISKKKVARNHAALTSSQRILGIAKAPIGFLIRAPSICEELLPCREERGEAARDSLDGRSGI